MTTTGTATIIDGRSLAASVREELSARISTLAARGATVRLDAVIVEGNEAGSVYAASQERTCGTLGIDYRSHRLPAEVDESELAALIDRLNADQDVHAIMVHLPLPASIDAERIQASIDTEKDVEGVNPANIGNVIYGRRSLVPCTALAAMTMIESTGIDLKGRVAVCVGASRIVGRPVAVLLMQAEATVISTNVHTPDLATHALGADVLISAAGVPGLVTGEMVRPGAIVIDVGINRVVDPATGKTRTIGDVDFDSVSRVAGWLSPVPGGVGPVTVSMLLRNTVESAERRYE